MTREASALVVLPLLSVLVLYGSPFVFLLCVVGAAMIAQHEFYRFHFRERFLVPHVAGLLLGCLIVVGLYREGGSLARETLTVSIILLLVVQLITGTVHGRAGRGLPFPLVDSAVVLLGLLYINWLLGHLVLLRGLSQGRELVLFLFAVTWGGDALAYYVGKGVGKHSLSPVLSPHKTVEGAIGGLLGSGLAGLLCQMWLFPGEKALEFFTVSLTLGALAQVGDLVESLFKRSAGVKDSSSLIPGHGGILDKVDSLILTAPALYYYLLLRSHGS